MINFEKFRKEYENISSLLSSPQVLKDQNRYRELSKRFAFLEKLLNTEKEINLLSKQKEELKSILSSDEDEALKELARVELENVEKKIADAEELLEEILFSGENQPDRDVIVEIRAAAGGEESALFAADLFRMYSRYAEKKGWKVEVLNSHPTEIGGFKEIIFSVRGEGSYAHFKFEMGVHRVQRVPVTEASGRIHTSTVTVAVLMEPKEVEININPDDLKIETFRASGHGGQHVNVTDSAVRITHLPTGIVVSCQDERSQMKNKAKAMRVLKARLLAYLQEQEQKKISQQRKMQVGTGERSEKIRTYNFPERRVTDHRINFTIYRLDEVLEGNLDLVVRKLIQEERKKMYEAEGLA